MFSYEYFKYLFKSKKYLLILIVLISLLTIISDVWIAVALTGVLSLFLCFVMPMNTFYYVHDKRAVDTYFAMPVSRKALLGSGLLFCLVCSYVPVFMGLLAFGIEEGLKAGLLLSYLFGILLAAATLNVFVTCIYLVANNVIDGAIMIAAYLFLPLALLIVLESFQDSYVAGYVNYSFDLIAYLSPLFMSVSLFVNACQKEALFLEYLIGLAVILVLFGAILYKSFLERKVERAGTPSTELMAYRFIIYAYLVLTLLCIGTSNDYYYVTIFAFLKDYFILYVILFAVFMTAYFIYKRKFFFNYKIVAYFLAALVATLIFSGLCKSTKGFGIAYNYPKNDADSYYQLNCWYRDQKTLKEVSEMTGEDVTYCSVYLVGNDRDRLRPINGNSVRIFESLRDQSIDEFYRYRKDDIEVSQQTNLSIHPKDPSLTSAYFHYTMEEAPDLATIKKLAEDPHVMAVISTEHGDYLLDGEGNLQFSEEWPLYLQ